MTEAQNRPWPDWPPIAGDEIATLLGSLERERCIFEWKCGGLDEAGLRATLGTSTMTVGGLLKHLARVEDDYFACRILGGTPAPPWDSVSWDWDWVSSAEDSAEYLYALWNDTVVRSRSLTVEILANGDLSQLGQADWEPEGRPNVRRHLMDLIEEYARHNGHADLIRESIDGLVGEGPD